MTKKIKQVLDLQKLCDEAIKSHDKKITTTAFFKLFPNVLFEPKKLRVTKEEDQATGVIYYSVIYDEKLLFKRHAGNHNGTLVCYESPIFDK